MRRYLIIPMFLSLAAIGCAAGRPSGPRGAQYSQPSAPSSSPRAQAPTTTQPILFHRTGGIAGTNDHLVVWPDGFVQVDGKLFTPAVARLADERHAKIKRMFDGWEKLEPAYLTNNIPDAYTITIHYGDKAVTANDIAPDLPAAFRDIFTELEAVAFDAQQQQNELKPPPAAP